MPARPLRRPRRLNSAFKRSTALIYELDRRLSQKGAGLEIPGPSHSTVERSVESFPDFSKPRYFEIPANLNQSLTSFHQSNTVVLPPIFQTSR